MDQFHAIEYLVSQYVWIIILGIFSCIPFFLKYTQETGKISSSNFSKPFNDSMIPTVFTHLSDIHVNHLNPTFGDNFNQLISFLTDTIKPDFNIITGDLVDNFKPPVKIPKYGTQQPDDYNQYLTFSKSLKQQAPLLEVDGNHDLFGVFSYYTKLKQNESQTIEDYFVSTSSFEIQGQNYTFIKMNPFDFPSPHPPYLQYAKSNQNFLNQLYSTIQNIPKDHKIVLLNHYPYHYWKFLSKSQKKTFEDVCKDFRIFLFLDGHLHPENPYVLHHHNFLEIVGSDLFEHHKFSLGFFDNGRFSYHTLELKNNMTNLAFITNPVETRFLTSHQIFNERNTWFRMVVYQNESPNIQAVNLTDDDAITNLTCSKKEKFWLCQAPLNLEFGVHKVSVTGDVNKTIKFIINDHIDSYSENIYEPFTSQTVAYQVQLGLIWAFLLIILCPFLPLSSNLSLKYHLWINGQSKENMIPFSIFLGFLAVKMRIPLLPKSIRYCLFVACLWPFVLPLEFNSIQGRPAVVWTWGFICQTAHYDLWGQMLALMYFTFILLPVTLMFSALVVSSPIRWTLAVDLIPPIGCAIVNLYIGVKYCNESGGMIGAIFSPAFTIAPIFFYILMIIWRTKWKDGLKSISIIPSVALLD